MLHALAIRLVSCSAAHGGHAYLKNRKVALASNRLGRTNRVASWRTMDSREAGTVDQPGAASATPHPPALQSVQQLPPGLQSPMGAPPQQLPYPYYPMAPNPIGGMAPPHASYSQSAPFFTIVGEHESLPPPVGPIGSQFPYGMAPFAGGVPQTLQSPMTPGALRAYSYPPMLSDPGGPSGIPRGGPTPSLMRPYNQGAVPTSELGLGQPANGREDGELSPNAIRKLSHNAVEVRRRRRISTQLDRLRTMLNRCPPPILCPASCVLRPAPARPALTPYPTR